VGVDDRGGVLRSDAPPIPRAGLAGRPASLGDLVDGEDIDTIVHVEMCPSRSGVPTNDRADVISTLQVAAAASGRGPVRTVVGCSSTEVYTASARAPVWRREDEVLRPRGDRTAALVLEAEDLLRDVAQHHPHVSVAILRLADLAGPGTWGGLSALLRGVVVPVVPGYDPPVQFLHPDDAVGAVEHAVARELAGTFNVAGEGVVRWSRAARATGRPVMPVMAGRPPFASMLWAFEVPSVPPALVDVLRFGRCTDIAALGGTEFTPAYSTVECLEQIAHRA
jgi:UDP-glucose 4-epimerase